MDSAQDGTEQAALTDQTEKSGGVLLLLQVPRTNEKKELAAEQMFASLHGLLNLPPEKAGFFKQIQREQISFEIAVIGKRIGFYVWVPDFLKEFVEEQIYAQYPNVHISEVSDFASETKAYPTNLATELTFIHHHALPIKTFLSFEVDPLAAITATLAKFQDNEEAWIQLILRPAASHWHRKSESYVSGIKNRGSLGPLKMLWQTENKAPVNLTDYEQKRVASAQQKSEKLAYDCSLRVIYRGESSDAQARLKIQSIVASYKQFNSTYLNGFESKKISTGPQGLTMYRDRFISANHFIANIEEVATLYHLPHTNVETPFILWSIAPTAEPPANLPISNEINTSNSLLAVTNFRGHNTIFGMPRVDRGRHLYVIGQTGTGKSALLELLTISDIYSPYGFAVIDPHGDYALSVLRRIPKERANDVVYFNPADVDYPMAFNPMEVENPKLKTHTCSELIAVVKRMFESWGPRLEYILRYTILALLDFPNATMLDITSMLTDKRFREKVLEYVTDPVVRNFWTVEFTSWNERFAAEAVAPVLNKIGAFTANPLVRNIIGQPKSSINIRQVMDQKKILIVNLSRGLVGEDNAALLGALLVTKIQMAAMSRADTPSHERTPFYLYVDEFQNFATDSFATILSEARKYGLNLTVANQYIAQMLPEVKDAVFGNVGSVIAFRTSADDARSIQRYFEPMFTEHDLVHLHNRHFVTSMTIEGEKAQAFSAITLDLPGQSEDNSLAIIEQSRANYTINRAAIEEAIEANYLTKPKQTPSKSQPLPKSRPIAKDQSQPEKPAVSRNERIGKAVVSVAQVMPAKPKRRRHRNRKRSQNKTFDLNNDSEKVIQLRK